MKTLWKGVLVALKIQLLQKHQNKIWKEAYNVDVFFKCA